MATVVIDDRADLEDVGALAEAQVWGETWAVADPDFVRESSALAVSMEGFASAKAADIGPDLGHDGERADGAACSIGCADRRRCLWSV